MRLLINTATTHKGGGVQVAKSFIEECEKFTQHQFIVVLGLNIATLINQKDFPNNFKFFEIPYRPATRVFSFKDTAEFLKKIEEEHKPDVVFTSSGPAYWTPKSPHLMGYNLPHYIYQDSPYFQKINTLQRFKWKLKGMTIKHFVKREATAYVVQTDDVAKQLRKWLKTNKNITTVSNTYGKQYNEVKRSLENVLPEMEKNEFRFLILSAYYKHKYFEILNEIIPLLLNKAINLKIKFVTTLPNEHYISVFSEEARKSILNLGPVKPDECPQLYFETQAVFLPTLLECFSATYAEAMRMKLPIVTTNLGFATSICGNAALYYEPIEAKDAFIKIMELVEKPLLYEDIVRNGQVEINKFNTPAQRAEKYLEICEGLISE